MTNPKMSKEEVKKLLDEVNQMADIQTASRRIIDIIADHLKRAEIWNLGETEFTAHVKVCFDNDKGIKLIGKGATPFRSMLDLAKQLRQLYYGDDRYNESLIASYKLPSNAN